MTDEDLATDDEAGIQVQVDGVRVLLQFTVPEAGLESPPIQLSGEQAVQLGVALSEAGRQARKNSEGAVAG